MADCVTNASNETLFTSLAQARTALVEWRRDYNTVRPHSSISWLTPAAYTTILSRPTAPSRQAPRLGPLPPIKPRSSTARL